MQIKVEVTKFGYGILLEGSAVALPQKAIFKKLFPLLGISYRNDTDNDTALVFTAKYNKQLIIDEELKGWFTLNAEGIKDRIEVIYDKVKDWYDIIPTSKVVFDLPIIE